MASVCLDSQPIWDMKYRLRGQDVMWTRNIAGQVEPRCTRLWPSRKRDNGRMGARLPRHWPIQFMRGPRIAGAAPAAPLRESTAS